MDATDKAVLLTLDELDRNVTAVAEAPPLVPNASYRDIDSDIAQLVPFISALPTILIRVKLPPLPYPNVASKV